jgi:hypothetical protein
VVAEQTCLAVCVPLVTEGTVPPVRQVKLRDPKCHVYLLVNMNASSFMAPEGTFTVMAEN